jgi:hypothetical protein
MGVLDRLLGTWEHEMHHSAMSEPVTGSQRYERVPDEKFAAKNVRLVVRDP